MAPRTKSNQRRQALTDSAIDYAVSAGADLWEASGEDAEQFADVAIDVTLDALGRDGEDSDSFDRDQVIRAIRVEFDPDFEADTKATVPGTDLTPSKVEAIQVLQAKAKSAPRR